MTTPRLSGAACAVSRAPRARRFFSAVGSLVFIAGLLPALLAQGSAGTGRVQGRVFNPATGEYVRNAEVRIQGTDRVTYSEDGGVYQFDNVSPGQAVLLVTFTGYQTATASVAITAGATATRDF